MIKSNTCIAVIKNKQGKLLMAGDRRCSWGSHQYQSIPWPKVVKRDGFLFGGTGDAHVLSLIANYMPITPDYNRLGDKYLYSIFFDNMRNFLKERSFENTLVETSTEILIGYQSRLYTMNIEVNHAKHKQHIDLLEINVPFATGCGGQLAWGSLLTTETLNMKPHERLKMALRVAAQVSAGCDNNIDIIEED